MAKSTAIDPPVRRNGPESPPPSVSENENSPTPKTAPATMGKGKFSPFDDMEALRKSNKAAFEGEKETAVVVTLGRPKKELYVRFHLNEDFYLPSCIWAESDDSRKIYYIASHLWSLEDLQGGMRAVILAPWLGADGSLGLWPASASSAAGEWYTSAQEVLTVGKREWIRIQADNREKIYRYYTPKKPVPHREWPNLTFGEICKRAFGSRVVMDEDHELIRKLRNE